MQTCPENLAMRRELLIAIRQALTSPFKVRGAPTPPLG